jgi:hypothetical protein
MTLHHTGRRAAHCSSAFPHFPCTKGDYDQAGADSGVIAGHQRWNVSRSLPLSVRARTCSSRCAVSGCHLIYDESAADHLIDGRFGDRRRNRFAVSATISIVGNEIAIRLQVVIQLVQRACQLATFGTFCNSLVVLDELDQGFDAL